MVLCLRIKILKVNWWFVRCIATPLGIYSMVPGLEIAFLSILFLFFHVAFYRVGVRVVGF